jgi:hypothetical protein
MQEHGSENIREMGMGGNKTMAPDDLLKRILGCGFQKDVSVKQNKKDVDNGKLLRWIAFLNGKNEQDRSSVTA